MNLSTAIKAQKEEMEVMEVSFPNTQPRFLKSFKNRFENPLFCFRCSTPLYGRIPLFQQTVLFCLFLKGHWQARRLAQKVPLSFPDSFLTPRIPTELILSSTT